MERELFAQSVLTNLYSRISPLWGLDGTTKMKRGVIVIGDNQEKPHLKVSQFNGFLPDHHHLILIGHSSIIETATISKTDMDDTWLLLLH